MNPHSTSIPASPIRRSLRNLALGGITLVWMVAPAACGGAHSGLTPKSPTEPVATIAAPDTRGAESTTSLDGAGGGGGEHEEAKVAVESMPMPSTPSVARDDAPASGGYAGGDAVAGPVGASAPRGYAPPPAPPTRSAPTAAATAAPSPTYAPHADKAKREAPRDVVAAGESAVAPPATTVTTTVTTTVHTGGGAVIAPPRETPQGGVLTAAIWDDNDKRAGFLTFVDRYPSFRSQWGLDLSRRVTIRVTDSAGVLVGDAPIALRAPDGSVVDLRTHGDGTALYYPPASMVGCCAQSAFAIAAQSGSLRAEGTFAAPSGDATWTLKLPGVPTRAQTAALDLAFVVDTTGSMGDEITYLQAELAGVVKRVKSEHAMRRVRLGLVLYKDRGDEYVTRSFDFTEDLSKFLGELAGASAAGGGDMPESVNQALRDTVKELSWAGDESARLAVLVADAPPHYYADEQYTYKNAINDLSARGVKLVTLGASGIDKSTEYVFRQMSAWTGGRYIFLTDDSGVGESHLTPDISGYQVEHLDRLLVRTIGEEVRAFQR
jgi:hypothetical protein